MAKRLNKKVAIIGSLVVVCAALLIIFALLFLSRDPQKYMADAEASLALTEPDYKAAEKAYKQAFAYSKRDVNLKLDILFKLSDMFVATKEWPKAAGCWEQVINFDTRNLRARLALLDYVYEIAMAGSWPAWKDVESHASELIDKELDTSPRIYRIKGQALLEQVKHGQVTDKEATIQNVIEILQKVNNDEPNNVDSYKYLADAITQQGEILAAKGVLGAMDSARQEAVKVLMKGVENLPNEPKSYINLYNTRFSEARANPDKYKELESDLIDLTEKFSSSPLPYFAMMQLYQTSPKEIDKAIESVGKAIELDRQNVSYAIGAANLYYKRYSRNKTEDDFQKAIDIAKEALTFPDSLDMPGPRARVNFVNRYLLRVFLADCFIDRAINVPSSQPDEKSKWIERAEDEVYQISQLLTSAENPYVIMWQGRLLLAKGQVNDAIVKMNAAYEILTASGEAQGDIQVGKLSYELAKVLRGSSEIGAVVQFYATAVKNGLFYTEPELLLDFASALVFMEDWQNALNAVDFFETNFYRNERSDALRVRAYIGANMFEQAKELLDKLSIEDPNVLKLKMAFLNKRIAQASWQLGQDANAAVQLLPPAEESREQLKIEYDAMTKERNDLRDKLVSLEAGDLREGEILSISKEYISEEQTDKAKKLIGDFLQEHPNNVNVRFYQLVLAEPAPANVPSERLEQLVVKAVESSGESVARQALLLGQFYQNKKQNDEAAEHYRRVLQFEPNNGPAIMGLFDTAISNQDYGQAEKLSETARQENTDLCGGEFFKARLAFAKKDYKNAIERINNCLEKRPIFSQAYLLRSQANEALQKESDAIDDIKKAYSLNPTDSAITRNLAYLLYSRNRELGASASTEQTAEFTKALVEAIRSNPADLKLKGFYAEYIGNTEPQRGMAICQQIQKFMPTVENSLVLGRLAIKTAIQIKEEEQRKVYLSIAEDAYKKAYELDPNDKRVLGAYSEFLAVTGKYADAEKVLAGRDDLLWRFYIRAGRPDKAQQLLEQLYKTNPEDSNTIKGLILVSKGKGDQAGVLKHTADLLKVDNSVESQIIEIESYLEAGLVDNAQTKLDSLCERYPDNPRTMFLKSWFLARQGKLEEALKLANRNLEVDKGNPRVWRLRGQINLVMNNLNQAIDDLQKSKMIQDDAEVRIDLARAYLRTNRAEEAIAELKAAADEQGSYAGRNMLEQVYLITGREDRLEKFYLETIEKFPGNTYWYNQAGKLALRRKEYNKAFMFFDAAFQYSLKINSESPDAQAFEGILMALLEAKKYDQMFTEASKYLEGPMAAIAYAKMAEGKALMGDKDTAVQYFRRALERAGTNEQYVISILQYMSEVVGSDETMKWCNEKLQSQPNSLVVNFAMVNLYKMTQNYDKALEYIDNCIRIAADNQQLKRTYQLNKANMLQFLFTKTTDKTSRQKLIEELESILQEQPTNSTILNNLAYILADTDMDIDKALKYAEKAYNAMSNNPEVLDTYGYVLLKSGKTKQADEFLQRALQQFEQNRISAPIEVYEHIGWAKEKLGRDDEALKAYKQAMELADENVAQEVKDRIAAEIERISAKGQ